MFRSCRYSLLDFIALFQAWLASLKGITLHTRCGSPPPNPLNHSERESQWTDPALPILAQARKYLGTLIIDSPTPSVTPHIIINMPPPYDSYPYVQLSNSTQNPQDSGFGRYLTVPSSFVEVINLPRCEDEGETHLSARGYDSISSILPTPSLLLPIEEEAEGELSFCSSESVCTFFGSEGDQDVDHCENKDGVCVAEDDEDEDDLPPLDDWYLQIASRTGITLQSWVLIVVRSLFLFSRLHRHSFSTHLISMLRQYLD
jgi:hypothetical protein